MHGRLQYAISLLLIAMLIDALDGMVARRLGVARPFGRYLGSFVDLINETLRGNLFIATENITRMRNALNAVLESQ